MSRKLRIAVLFGGTSMERDVSVASAAQVVRALRDFGHQVVAVDGTRGRLSDAEESTVLFTSVANCPPPQVDNAPLACLFDAKTFADCDLVFLALHGGIGEDGTVQAILDVAGIPYTGSGHLGSALAMDKDVSKHLFLEANVPTADWRMAPVTAVEVQAALGFPVIVKPNSQGSTVGLTLVNEMSGLEAAIDTAAQFDHEVMLERYIPGRELTVGILDGQPLPVGEIIPIRGELFDYESKYQPGGANELFPADIDSALAQLAQQLAVTAANTLKLSNYCRVDFRLDPQGRLWCLEANTLPGLTSGSLLPRGAAAAGIAFPELCDRIARFALK